MFAACLQKRWEITTKPATNPMPSWQEKSWQEIKSGQWITPPHIKNIATFCDIKLSYKTQRITFSIMFVLAFFVPLENFHSFEEVTIASEGLLILTYARHLWQLSRGFFSVPHLLWHETSVYNGHLRGPLT